MVCGLTRSGTRSFQKIFVPFFLLVALCFSSIYAQQLHLADLFDIGACPLVVKCKIFTKRFLQNEIT